MSLSLSINSIFETNMEDHEFIEDKLSADEDFQQENKTQDLKKIVVPTIPMNTSPYYESTLKRFRRNEKSRFLNHISNSEIRQGDNKRERNSIVKTIINKAIQMDIEDEPTFLAVKIFDFILRFKEHLPGSMLLNGYACLIIAAKLEEYEGDINFEEFISDLCNVSKKELSSSELFIMKILGFNPLFITPIMYLKLFIQKVYAIDNSVNINEIYKLAKVIAFCSLFSESCSNFSSESIAKESIRLALEKNQKGEIYSQLNLTIESSDCSRCIQDTLTKISQNESISYIAKIFCVRTTLYNN